MRTSSPLLGLEHTVLDREHLLVVVELRVVGVRPGPWHMKYLRRSHQRVELLCPVLATEDRPCLLCRNEWHRRPPFVVEAHRAG